MDTKPSKPNIDAMTNSGVMVLAKMAAKEFGVDLYRGDPNQFLRHMLKGYFASVTADQLLSKSAPRRTKRK